MFINIIISCKSFINVLIRPSYECLFNCQYSTPSEDYSYVSKVPYETTETHSYDYGKSYSRLKSKTHSYTPNKSHPILVQQPETFSYVHEKSHPSKTSSYTRSQPCVTAPSKTTVYETGKSSSTEPVLVYDSKKEHPEDGQKTYYTTEGYYKKYKKY